MLECDCEPLFFDDIPKRLEELKEWLLFNGTDNDVMHAILKITEALMDEGPIPGLSNMDNPEVLLSDILYRIEEGKYPFTEKDLKIIKDIQDYKTEL